MLPRDNRRGGGLQSLRGGVGPLQMQSLCFRMAEVRTCTLDSRQNPPHGSSYFDYGNIALIVLLCAETAVARSSPFINVFPISSKLFESVSDDLGGWCAAVCIPK